MRRLILMEGGAFGRPTVLAGMAFVPEGRLRVAFAVRARRGSDIIAGSSGQSGEPVLFYDTTRILDVG